MDWWSLGALVYDMVTGSPPFCTNNRKKTIEKITKGQLRFPPYITDSLKDLLRKLLCRDVTKRLGSKGGAAEIKAHPWFRKIDWKAAEERTLQPPFAPIVVRAADDN